jgi:hypothetical protein
MYENENTDYMVNNSSSFVGYMDYTDSSVNNYSFPYRPLNEEREQTPTVSTLMAILEAINGNNLHTFHNVDDFFGDLET